MKNKRSRKQTSNSKIAGSVQNPSSFIQTVSKVEKYRFTVFSTLTSSVGGTTYIAYVVDPSVSPEWSSVSALYTEFRVLGGQATFLPIDLNTLTADSGLVIAYDNLDFSTPSGPNALLAYSTRALYSLARDTNPNGFIYTWKVPTVGGNTSILWQKVSGFSTQQSLKIANFAGFSVSTPVCSIVFDYFVEFRTRV